MRIFVDFKNQGLLRFLNAIYAQSLANLEDGVFIWEYRWSHCGIGFGAP